MAVPNNSHVRFSLPRVRLRAGKYCRTHIWIQLSVPLLPFKSVCFLVLSWCNVALFALKSHGGNPLKKYLPSSGDTVTRKTPVASSTNILKTYSHSFVTGFFTHHSFSSSGQNFCARTYNLCLFGASFKSADRIVSHFTCGCIIMVTFGASTPTFGAQFATILAF